MTTFKQDSAAVRPIPCDHGETETTRHGTYCAKCGMRMISEPDEVSLLYYQRMADARQSNWHELVEVDGRIVPLGLPINLAETYVGACLLQPEGVWALIRVRWCENCGHWEVAQPQSEHHCDHTPAPITHLSRDVLGTPRLR